MLQKKADYLLNLGALLTSALLFSTGPTSLASEKSTSIKAVTDPKENSPKEALRQKIFGDTAVKSSCASMTVDPTGDTKGLDKELDRFLKTLVTALREHDQKTLLPLFHARLSIGLPAVEESFAKLSNVYGTPLDVTMHRLWALNTVDGAPTGLACEERQTVFPQYGYPLQFAAWLQIMGPKELGRLYVGIVPIEGKWVIGAFRAQQWTHASLDFASWAEEAVKLERMGHKEAAFIKYDVAAKLLDGGGFLELGIREDVIKARDAVMSPTAWDQAIRDTLNQPNIVYTATLLVVNGGGILVRIKTDQELAMETIKSNCETMAKTVMKKPWAAYVEGMRCSYNFPKEDPKTEGVQGGIYLSFDDLRKAH